jgi:hypothetical protein
VSDTGSPEPLVYLWQKMFFNKKHKSKFIDGKTYLSNTFIKFSQILKMFVLVVQVKLVASQ